MCHSDPLSGLKDWFSGCCSATSRQLSAILRMLRTVLTQLMLLSQGSPHSETGWHGEYKNLAPTPQLGTMMKSPPSFSTPQGVRSPLKLRSSLPSPLPNTGFFPPFHRGWSQEHFLGNFQHTNFSISESAPGEHLKKRAGRIQGRLSREWEENNTRAWKPMGRATEKR